MGSVAIYVIISVVATAVITAAVTWALASKLGRERIQAAQEAADKVLQVTVESHEKAMATAQEVHEKAMTEQLNLFKSEMQAHNAQLQAQRAEMQAQNAQMQKENGEALKKEAGETFRNIAGTLGEDIRKMKESFEAQKKEHHEQSASIKAQFETTARTLIDQTNQVSRGAESLAAALRGRNKMQGCLGETLLANIFQQEGMVEGRDFDREVTLRDASGTVLQNADTGQRMRPDFVLHFPDNTDVIVDSKVSLAALSDYFQAADDAAREEAAARNLQSVVSHIKELTTKEYQKYASSGRRTLDYTIMFIPNYGAYQLAKQLQPNLFADAFAKNVLITTEETIMPFLRIIRTAWVNQEQINNQQKIIDQAQMMVDRVAAFCEDNEKMGKRLKDALEIFDTNKKKLEEGGKSIVHAANEVIRLGVPKPKRALPNSNE